MGYFLLLDSSNVDLCVGVSKDGALLDGVTYEAWQRQSELMIPEIEKLFNKHGINKDNLEGVVVSIGPGSYTGVRISVTIAKVMGVALNIPVYPCSSLNVLCDYNRPSIALINARSKRSYIGVYKEGKALLKDTIFTNDEVLEYIKNHPEYIVCGDTKYLGINHENSEVLKEMVKLLPGLEPCKDILSLKPVYLKETYDTK